MRSRGFGFLAHGNPDIGVKQVRALGGGLDVLGDDDFSAGARAEFPGRADNPLGAAMRNSKPSLAAAKIQELAMLHAPSPMKRHDLARGWSRAFPEGENVREDLAGMLVIRQGVDGRDSRRIAANSSTSLWAKVRMTAPWTIRPKHARGVLDRFAAAKLNVIRS